MKIAVPYDNGQIFQHFGHTEQFKIYEAEGRKVLSDEVVSTNGAGHGALSAFLTEHGVDTVICGGIGPGAVNALQMADIRVYAGVTGSANGAVQAVLDGVMGYNPNPTCDHHHEEGGCHSGSCGSCGHH